MPKCSNCGNALTLAERAKRMTVCNECASKIAPVRASAPTTCPADYVALVNHRLSPKPPAGDGVTPLADCPGRCGQTYGQREPGGAWLPL